MILIKPQSIRNIHQANNIKITMTEALLKILILL